MTDGLLTISCLALAPCGPKTQLKPTLLRYSVFRDRTWAALAPRRTAMDRQFPVEGKYFYPPSVAESTRFLKKYSPLIEAGSGAAMTRNYCQVDGPDGRG